LVSPINEDGKEHSDARTEGLYEKPFRQHKALKKQKMKDMPIQNL
jgi:hypothetical protein